jgi:hypothetical protein
MTFGLREKVGRGIVAAQRSAASRYNPAAVGSFIALTGTSREND